MELKEKIKILMNTANESIIDALVNATTDITTTSMFLLIDTNIEFITEISLPDNEADIYKLTNTITNEINYIAITYYKSSYEGNEYGGWQFAKEVTKPTFELIGNYYDRI